MAHKNKSNYSPLKAQQKSMGYTPRGRGHLQSSETFSFNEASDRLYDLFRNHDFLNFTPLQMKDLVKFYCLLVEGQKEQNFTRLTTLRDIGIKHFMDSLILPQLTDLQFPLLDIGTGPGLPGIPLKIMFREQEIFLAEGVQKRVEFLKKVRTELGFVKLGIFGRNINPQFLYPVRGVVTRAVEDIGNTLNNIKYTLQTGGEVYFLKGPGVDLELKTALSEHSEFYELKKDISYELPKTTQQRRLIIFKKIKAHPQLSLDSWLNEQWDEKWNEQHDGEQAGDD